METSSRPPDGGLSLTTPPPPPADRLQALAADISARLRRVCAHLSDEEFSALVMDIAQVTLRYEEAQYGSAPAPRPPAKP